MAADPGERDDAERLEEPAARPAGVLGVLGGLGAASQASVPGLYAWGVTVAPAAFAKSEGLTPKVFAATGLLALLLGILLDRRWGARARYVAVWGLVLSSSVVWVLVPRALGLFHLDAGRGLAGMLGWALFAFASAAPALGRDAQAGDRIVEDEPLKPRTALRRGDAIYIGGGVLLAVGLQVVGWRVDVPERALLVRLVAIASGLAIIGAATTAALARHGRAPMAPNRARLRRVIPWLAALLVAAALGLVLVVRS